MNNLGCHLSHKFNINMVEASKELVMTEEDDENFESFTKCWIYTKPNGLDKYVSFNLDNKSVFINSFMLLSSPLDCSIKNLGGNDFRYLNQELDSEVLDLGKEKEFYPYEHKCDFEKFVKTSPSKSKVHSSFDSKEISDKGFQHNKEIKD